MDNIRALDHLLFLFLNELHTPWLDPIMFYATNTFFWIPLFLFILYTIIKQEKWKGSLYPIIGIAITIALSDQVTSGFMKPFFARLRPSHELSLEGIIHIVNEYKGGQYGFPSSHAANSFALLTFLYAFFNIKTPLMLVLVAGWAVVFSYTRIYLGVHYPLDIIVGVIVGCICGMCAFFIVNQLKHWRIKAIVS